MSLPIGTRLGAFEVLSPIGAGGMGEVYRARDTKLDRDVALKILPERLARDADALARFEREAKAVAALSHPNILAIHDFGREGTTSFAAMELLEGETLRAKLDGGALPQRRAVEIAIQIARGLAAAHERGVIHRDVKPENLFVTSDGRVKILDFGLAKLVPREPMQTSAPTTPAGTEPGTVLGTVGYMSPEQVRGRETDQRTDLFSLGAILYEMLSGRRAFKGDSQVETMNAILKEEPPDLPGGVNVSPALERIVRHCLEKSPEARFHSAGDVAFALDSLSSSTTSLPSGAAAAPAMREGSPRLSLAALLVAALAATLGIAFVVGRAGRQEPASPHRTVRFVLQPPEGTWFSNTPQSWSPDGTTLLFATHGANGKETLWTRHLDEVEAKPVAVDSAEPAYPFWSPDGKDVVFESGGRVVRLGLADGRTRTLCDASVFFGGSWGPGGDILLVPSYEGGIHRVSAQGGSPVPATTLDKAAHEIAHLRPTFLADGRRFLYFARVKHGVQQRDGWICAGSLDGKSVGRLRAADMFVGATDREILFMDEQTLLSQRYDPKTLTLVGEPVAVPGRVNREGDSSMALAAVSSTGVLALRSDPPRLQRILEVDRTGRELRALGAPEEYLTYVNLSANGRFLATSRRDPHTSLMSTWIIDVQRGIASHVGSERVEERSPALSPDGRTVAFASDREGPYDLVLRSLDGSAKDRVLLATPFDKLYPSWTRDGKSIVFFDLNPGSFGYRRLAADGSGTVESLRDGGFRTAEITADGRWLIYASSATGRSEVYAQGVGPGGGGTVRVSTNGGRSPRAGKDGREIYFVSLDGDLMAAPWNAGEPAPGAPIPLFRMPGKDSLEGTGTTPFDAAPDGKSFFIVQPVDTTFRTELTIVLDGLPR